MVEENPRRKRGAQEAELGGPEPAVKRMNDGISSGGINNEEMNELFDLMEGQPSGSGRLGGDRERERQTPPAAASSGNKPDGGSVDAFLALMGGHRGVRPAEEERPFDKSRTPVAPHKPAPPRTLLDFWDRRKDRGPAGR